MLALLVRNGLQQGRTFPLATRGRFVIGRGVASAVLLPDEGVSRSHAELAWKEGAWVLKDLDSTNGTFVNALPALEARLVPGDVVMLGPIEMLLTESASPPQPSPPGPAGHGPRGPVATHHVTSGPGRRILGASRAVKELIAQVKALAGTDVTVLVLGETGTGKELVAHAIHAASRRAQGPFVAVNCGAIAEHLVESELFGHEAGSFTGAAGRRIGHFEAASGGTLFLDEIGDLPMAAQAKLLRVLENRTLRRVGGTEEVRVDVRILAATHRDLARAMAERAFREDLYHRLRVAELRVPPLRERPGDVAVLAAQFASRIAMEIRKPGLEIDAGAMARLAAYPWPGNVRELKNALERAAITAPGKVVSAEHLDFLKGPADAGPAGGGFLPLKQWEEAQAKAHILRALQAAGGSKTEAARLLGISRQNLYQRLRLYGIEP